MGKKSREKRERRALSHSTHVSRADWLDVKSPMQRAALEAILAQYPDGILLRYGDAEFGIMYVSHAGIPSVATVDEQGGMQDRIIDPKTFKSA